MPLHPVDSEDVPLELRDSVKTLREQEGRTPPIVSISDIHGYLDEARSALLTVGEVSRMPPVVEQDADGRLHWAGESYVLVFNGDLVDRGPENEGVLKMVSRLIAEAPTGRVRVTLGNHEAIMLSRDVFGFAEWYSGGIDDEGRRVFLEQLLAGHVVAAYEGYTFTYAHAGLLEDYTTKDVNDELVEAAEELLAAMDTLDRVSVQQTVLDDYCRVLGVGQGHLKGPGAGLVWLDFSHLPADAPPQIVGHTRHRTPVRKGNVYCQNVLRENLDSHGGECVFLETPDSLTALLRAADGGVERVNMTSPPE